MHSATDAVKGGQKIWRATKQYDVPRQMLQDRINGCIVHGTNSGSKPIYHMLKRLNWQSFLVDTAKARYGKSRKQVQMIATNVVHDKQMMSLSKRVSNGWYYRFMLHKSP